MEKKNIIPGWLSLIILAIGVGSVTYNLMGITTDSTGFIGFINYLFYIIASISFVLYCLYGYKKKVAEYFTVTSVTFSFAQLVSIINAGNVQNYVSVFLFAGSFACLCIISIAKDLGKKNSLFLVYIVAILSIINLIYCACKFGLSITSGDLVTNVIISLIFVIMVYAKYADKASRGSK